MLLAIDTSTQRISLALHDGQDIRAELTWTSGLQHTTRLTPAIQSLLGTAEVAFSALTLLAVAEGPGSFNGLRVGISAAKGLAMSLNLPLIAVPTLDIVAAAQPLFAGDLIAIAHAGRGRVCAARYLRQADRWQPVADSTRIVGWEALIAEIASPCLIAGEVDAAARAQIAQSGKPITVATAAYGLRRAGFMAELAWNKHRAGDPGDPLTVKPFYLHQPGVPHP